MSIIEINTLSFEISAFDETALTKQKCICCGDDVDGKSSRDTGPKEKDTCSYSCYRTFWLFRKKLGDLSDHPNLIAYLITLINNGSTVEEVKIIYKKEKKRKFMGPYSLEVQSN